MSHLHNLFHHYFPHLALADALLFFLLVFTRWTVMTVMIPFLGAQLLPSMVRVAVAALLSVASFMALSVDIDFSQDLNITLIVLLFIKEGLVGFILGFLASLIFSAYEICGDFIDFFRAANMSRLLVPELKHQASPLGTLLFQLSLVMFLGLGLEQEVLKAAFMSFDHFPVLKLAPSFLNDHFLSSSLLILQDLFAIALRLSMPVVAVSLLLDVGFGLLNRIAPSVNAYFLSLPAKMVGGLIIFFFMLPFLIEDFYRIYREHPRFSLPLLWDHKNPDDNHGQ